MAFLKQSFSMLLWRPFYALAFYLTACAALACVIAYGRSVGISERHIIWGALALVLPLNVIFCLVWRLVGQLRRGLAALLRKRIGLAASYVALVSVVYAFGATCSSITTAIFVKIGEESQAEEFPWGLYAKVTGIELGFMLVVLLVPAVMWWLWAPPGTVQELDESVFGEPAEARRAG
jgi:hypothetical protein